MPRVSRYRKTQYKEKSETETDKNIAEFFHGTVKRGVASDRPERQQSEKRRETARENPYNFFLSILEKLFTLYSDRTIEKSIINVSDFYS